MANLLDNFTAGSYPQLLSAHTSDRNLDNAYAWSADGDAVGTLSITGASDLTGSATSVNGTFSSNWPQVKKYRILLTFHVTSTAGTWSRGIKFSSDGTGANFIDAILQNTAGTFVIATRKKKAGTLIFNTSAASAPTVAAGNDYQMAVDVDRTGGTPVYSILFGPSGSLAAVVGASFTSVSDADAGVIGAKIGTEYYDAADYRTNAYIKQITTTDNTTLPNAITGLAVTPGTSLNSLAWTAPAAGTTPTGYNVYQSVDNITYNYVGSPAGTATTYTDSGLTNGTLYYYKVRTVANVSESADSSIVSGTPSGTSFTAGDRTTINSILTILQSNTPLTSSDIDGSFISAIAGGVLVTGANKLATDTIGRTLLQPTGLDAINITDVANDADGRSTFPKMMRALFNRLFNHTSVTATQLKVRNDADTVVSTQTVSDDTTTATVGKSA